MKRATVSQSPTEPATRREQILELLRAAPKPLAIIAIAEQLGTHPNTVRFHLDGLVDAGRVDQLSGESAGPGRPAHLYQARRQMDRNGPSNYRLLAQIMTSRLAATERNPRAAAIELGRTWGPSLIGDDPVAGTTRTAAVNKLTGLLAALGFKPEPSNASRAKDVRLRHCPFLDVVDDHADIVCSLHLGLMQGALVALNAPLTVDQLDRFVEPDLCVAHLSPSARPADAT